MTRKRKKKPSEPITYVVEDGRRVPLKCTYDRAGSPMTLQVHPELAVRLVKNPKRSVRRLQTLMGDNLMTPDVIERVRGGGVYQGIQLSGVNRFMIRLAGKKEKQLVGAPPTAYHRRKDTLVFTVDPSGDIIDQFCNSLRRVLNQPPIEIDFQATPVAAELIRAGVIPQTVVDRQRQKTCWLDQDFGQSGGRSVLDPLESPVVVENPVWGPIRYTHGKGKGAVHQNGVLQPSTDEQYERPEVDGGGEVKLADIDRATGKCVELDQNNPMGGIMSDAAENEARIWELGWNAGCALDFCLETGECRDRRFRGGDPMGALNYLVSGDESNTFDNIFLKAMKPFLDAADLSTGRIDPSKYGRLQKLGGVAHFRIAADRLFMEYGMLLDRANSAGIYPGPAHFRNVKGIRTRSGEILHLKDFTSGKYFGDLADELKVGYRALTLALAGVHMRDFPIFGNQDEFFSLQSMVGFNPYVSLLYGYFPERKGDDRLYFQRHGHGPTVDPLNLTQILVDGRDTSVHELGFPEIGLLWDKVGGIPGEETPKTTTFLYANGVEVHQNELPQERAASQQQIEANNRGYDDRCVRLRDLGIGLFTLSDFGNRSRYSIHRRQNTLDIIVPRGGGQPFFDAALRLMDEAIAELS